MSASKMKYFNAVFCNKKNEVRLKQEEFRLDEKQKKMLTRFWHNKYSLLDELVQINVKTPRYVTPGKGQTAMDETCISLGEMNLDDKLFSCNPISFGQGSTSDAGSIAPVIEIEGSDAICYPNKEAKRGRRVPLHHRTTRRMEAVRFHQNALNHLSYMKEKREMEKPYGIVVRRRPVLRPATAAGTPRNGQLSARIRQQPTRPKTSLA